MPIENTPFTILTAQAKLKKLRILLRQRIPLLVAYSGGVDSTFLLAEAVASIAENVLGVIADSPSLPRKSLNEALRNAELLGARIEVLKTDELNNRHYAENPPNRCYFCKAELFRKMADLATSRGAAALAYGENADDAFEFRPGATAAAEFRVLAPLREVGLTKAEIRLLSRARGLSTADVPAQPCLSSRIPHGTSVTREALAMIEAAEDYVRSEDFRVFRVRFLAENSGPPIAKLQIAPNEMRLLPGRESRIRQALLGLGFRSVIIDPEGYRSPAKARAP